MMHKLLQGSDTASGTVLLKRCSRICGLNPGWAAETMLTGLVNIRKADFF